MKLTKINEEISPIRPSSPTHNRRSNPRAPKKKKKNGEKTFKDYFRKACKDKKKDNE